MLTIDLRKDVVVVRNQLLNMLADVAKIAAAEPVRALEVGYECCDGWFVIYAVRQQAEYEPRGDWAGEVNDDERFPMPHWGVFMSEYFGEQAIRVVRVDGSSFDCPSADDVSEDEPAYPELFIASVGEMLAHVLVAAIADNRFEAIGPKGTIQAVVEELNCSWDWRSNENLRVLNLP